jgi:dihydrofolate reductase
MFFIYYSIATFLDGFIAKKIGNIDWLFEVPNPGNSDYGFSYFLKTIDAVVMGKNTYELVLTFKNNDYNDVLVRSYYKRLR